MDFILEGSAIDGGSSSSCSCRITSLYHKVWYDSVKDCAIVISLSGEFYKVLDRGWGVLGVELNDTGAKTGLE